MVLQGPVHDSKSLLAESSFPDDAGHHAWPCQRTRTLSFKGPCSIDLIVTFWICFLPTVLGILLVLLRKLTIGFEVPVRILGALSRNFPSKETPNFRAYIYSKGMKGRISLTQWCFFHDVSMCVGNFSSVPHGYYAVWLSRHASSVRGTAYSHKL